MSMSLLINTAASDLPNTDWKALQTAAGIADNLQYANEAIVVIDEDTADQIANLVKGVTLSNQEQINSHSGEDSCCPSWVEEFAPSLLPTQIQDQIRDRLATTTNGKYAVRLLNEVLRLKLKISFSGKEFIDAHIKAHRTSFDAVEINRSNSGMLNMMTMLGFSSAELAAREVSFDTFSAALAQTGHLTDMPERLNQFVAFAKAQKAQSIYWA